MQTCSFIENGSPLRRQQDGSTGEDEDGGCHIRSPGGVGFIAAAKSSPFVTYRVRSCAGTVRKEHYHHCEHHIVVLAFSSFILPKKT